MMAGERDAGAGGIAVVGGQVCDFSRLTPVYGLTATTRIAAAWEQGGAGYSAATNKARTYRIIRFFEWLAAAAVVEDEPWAKPVFYSLQSGLAVNGSELQISINQFRNELADPSTVAFLPATDLVTRQRFLQWVSDGIRVLAQGELWPHTIRPRAVLRGTIRGGNIPSLGELRARGQPDPPPTDWRALAALNRSRLSRLRDLAVERLQATYGVYERGQRLIASVACPALDRADLSSRLTSLGLVRGANGGHLEVLPLANRERAEAEVLAFAAKHRGGRIAESLPKLRWQINQLGLVGLRQSMEGGGDALVAAQFIVLIDTGLNVSVSDDLAAEPFVGRAVHGEIGLATVSAVKLRAHGALIEAEIPAEAWIGTRRGSQGVSGQYAIRIWQEMSGRPRARAREHARTSADYLWITARERAGEVEEILARADPNYIRPYVKRFLKLTSNDPIVGGLNIRRTAIRPTFEQIRNVEGDFDQALSAKSLGHKHVSSAAPYVRREWLNRALDEKMRQFIEVFEVTLSRDLEDVHDKLGLNETQWDETVAEAHDTGIGFICATPTSSPQPHAVKSGPCTMLDRCAECPSRRFVPTPKALDALVLVNRSLRVARDEFEASDPSRWAYAWLPLLALTEAIIEKLSSQHRRFSLKAATERVDTALGEGALRHVVFY